MNNPEIQEDLQRFKTEMLMYRPFFGDILLRLPIVQDDSFPTACTDGRTIRWNSRFFASLSSAQRHYVLMHEVLHTLLMHPVRMKDYDPDIWNVAADMVVNSMCDKIAREVNANLPEKQMERPPDGIYAAIENDVTVESLYGRMKVDFEKQGGQAVILDDYRNGRRKWAHTQLIKLDSDLQPAGGNGRILTQEEARAMEEGIKALIRGAAKSDRSSFGSYYMPRELVELTKPKPVSWRWMLKEHLTEVTSEEASYTTPERKYLHMDLILPGYGLNQEGDLETLWAFVDSSGSIGGETLNQFLTQLYRIVKEFRCELNLCYWDTEVTEVYRRIRSEKQVLQCQPHHSGGTDINCVYRWMEENHVKPDTMLILTDGAFGQISSENRKLLRPWDTVLVLSNGSVSPEYVKIGRVCRLI